MQRRDEHEGCLGASRVTRYRARPRLPQLFTPSFETSYFGNVACASEGCSVEVLDASVVERVACTCAEASGSFQWLGGLAANLRSQIARPA